MTGVYVRIEREDRWQVVDIASLSRDELDAEASAHPEDGPSVALRLQAWVLGLDGLPHALRLELSQLMQELPRLDPGLGWPTVGRLVTWIQVHQEELDETPP